MSEPVKIVCVVEGGVLQNVLSCGVPIECVLIDYDVEGMGLTERGIRYVQQGDGNVEPAIVARIPVEMDDPAGNLALFKLADAQQCKHEWLDARNAIIKSGEICLKCGALRAGNTN